jgi:ABC-type branched-subunit amino acid transport system ATPase component/ABC-type branched-subunit amino acid transport system permease subunit
MLFSNYTPIRLVTVLIWIGIGAIMPLLIGTDVEHLGQLEYIVALVMVGIGLNIVLGYAGQVFLGPGALMCAGGYAAAVLANYYTPFQNLPMMCLGAVVVALILAGILATTTLRAGGFYLGMITLFMALVIPTVASNWSVTGGQEGLNLLTIPGFNQSPSGVVLYEVGVAMVAVICGYAWIIRNSRLGRRFGSLLSSEDMAQSVGVSLYNTKLIAFLLAAVPCGLAGAYYVYSQQFMSPDSITVQESIYILAGVVVGGAGTIIGPVIGVALVGGASQFLGGFQQYEGIVFGVALVLVAILMPTGVIGLYHDMVFRFMGGRLQKMMVANMPRIKDETIPLIAPPLDSEHMEPLVISDARRSFGGVRAVDGVDLVVERGQVHALVGPNGSGKTTLLNLITGFYKLDGGKITIGERRLDTMGGVARIAHSGVARTFQTPKLNPYETSLGNVMLGADRTANGMMAGAVLHTPKSIRNDREETQEALRALKAVGLTDQTLSLASLIPHGNQRLLELARVIALEPEFVLLDEPAAGLSAGEAEVLKRVVRDMAAAGYGVLIVEHNLPIVFDIAEKVTVLNQGQVIASGTPAEVAADPEVVRVYIGRQKLDTTPTPPTVPAAPAGVSE